MSEPILYTKKLTKYFGKLAANSEIDISVKRGEIHAIAGENGAGKSTLMKMLFGIYTPSSGEIVVDGRKMSRWNPTLAREMGIGMVFQDFRIVPAFTVLENIFLTLKHWGSQVVVYNRPKAVNETIYYNVDKLHSAIYHNRKITFQYADWTARKETILRHNGALYEVSPFHLVWDDENYYLIAYDENAGKIKHYRVDKMRSIDVAKLERVKLPEEKKIDLATFAKKTFGMFGGRDVKVTLRCKNHLAGVLIDRFGTDIWMTPSGEDHFTAQVTVTVSKQFFGWVTAIGKDMKIQAPLDVKDEYRQYLLEIFQDLDTES